jgi:probable F420-dependent oxidoreductase
MDIGVFFFTSGESADPAIVAKKAEDLGFASIWAPEHPVLPVHTTVGYPAAPDQPIPRTVGIISDPFVALARASATTTKIKLGTGICLVPERNPLLLAKEIATLDHYSGGRFLFGIGAGWQKEETEIMGGDFPRRWTQTRDSILAMKELWTTDESEYHGKYYDFPAVKCFPKPAQKPHPPVLLGGSAKNVFKRTVEWGDGWMPVSVSPKTIKQGRETLNELATAAGRDPASISVMAFGQPGQLRKKENLEGLEEAGAEHAIIWLNKFNEAEVIDELETLAAELL